MLSGRRNPSEGGDDEPDKRGRSKDDYIYINDDDDEDDEDKSKPVNLRKRKRNRRSGDMVYLHYDPNLNAMITSSSWSRPSEIGNVVNNNVSVEAPISSTQMNVNVGNFTTTAFQSGLNPSSSNPIGSMQMNNANSRIFNTEPFQSGLNPSSSNLFGVPLGSMQMNNANRLNQFSSNLGPAVIDYRWRLNYSVTENTNSIFNLPPSPHNVIRQWTASYSSENLPRMGTPVSSAFRPWTPSSSGILPRMPNQQLSSSMGIPSLSAFRPYGSNSVSRSSISGFQSRLNIIRQWTPSSSRVLQNHQPSSSMGQRQHYLTNLGRSDLSASRPRYALSPVQEDEEDEEGARDFDLNKTPPHE